MTQAPCVSHAWSTTSMQSAKAATRSQRWMAWPAFARLATMPRQRAAERQVLLALPSPARAARPMDCR